MQDSCYLDMHAAHHGLCYLGHSTGHPDWIKSVWKHNSSYTCFNTQCINSTFIIVLISSTSNDHNRYKRGTIHHTALPNLSLMDKSSEKIAVKCYELLRWLQSSQNGQKVQLAAAILSLKQQSSLLALYYLLLQFHQFHQVEFCNTEYTFIFVIL